MKIYGVGHDRLFMYLHPRQHISSRIWHTAFVFLRLSIHGKARYRIIRAYNKSQILLNETIHNQHSTFLHSSQDVPCAKRLKSRIVNTGAITVTFLGRHNPIRFHGGTQNNSIDGEFCIQPFFKVVPSLHSTDETSSTEPELTGIVGFASHTLIVPSAEADTMCLSSPENVTEVTVSM